LEPLDHVGKGLLTPVKEVLQEGNAGLVDNFRGKADFPFFVFSRIEGAEIGQLEKQAFARIDAESLFDDPVESKCAGSGEQEFEEAFDVADACIKEAEAMNKKMEGPFEAAAAKLKELQPALVKLSDEREQMFKEMRQALEN
jgi:hypothetical protein